MAYLGNTLTEIARTKSGIIKEGSNVVLAQQQPDVATELMRRVAQVGANVAREGVEFSLTSRNVAVGGQLLTVKGLGGVYEDIFLPLHGKHQGENAATALVAVESFFGGQELDQEAVRTGFAQVASPGRCEVVHRDPTIILDAAHNPHGAKALAQTLENEFTFDEIIGVVGVFADKEVEEILRELEPIVNTLIVTESISPRALPVEDLARIAMKIFEPDRVIIEPRLQKAITSAISAAKSAENNESVGIVITGSVTTVGQSRAIIKGIENE